VVRHNAGICRRVGDHGHRKHTACTYCLSVGPGVTTQARTEFRAQVKK
jgi:hypothetical protein